MIFTITVCNARGVVKARAQAEDDLSLVYDAPYEEGDYITLTSELPGFVFARLEDSLPETFAYLSGEFLLRIPFGEKRVSYSPKSFTGALHLLTVRIAQEHEIGVYRNLACNPLDSHDNTALFPHASANVETRGEAVFAARNAVDSCHSNEGHGNWPYQSWGINRQEDARLTIEFGRKVTIDRLVFVLRADFPHDNWWQTITVSFSDGSCELLRLLKTRHPQIFDICPRTITRLQLDHLQKDPSDPSPFPALTQIEAWGG